MATTTAPLPPEVTTMPARTPGGAFLITDPTPASCFFPEDFTDEQRQIAQTTSDFAMKEVLPLVDAIEAKDFSLTRKLIKQAAELGLTAVDIPEEYGGLEMDKMTAALIAEKMSVNGSFSTAFSAHTGIGTFAAGLVRHAGAEGEVSAKDRRRKLGRGVRLVGGLLRLGTR